MNKSIKPNHPQEFKENPPQRIIEIIFISDLAGYCEGKEREIEIGEILEVARNKEETVELNDLFFRERKSRKDSCEVGFRIHNLHYDKQFQDYQNRKLQSDLSGQSIIV